MRDAAPWLIVTAFLSSPVLAIVVSKYFRPNATPLEILQEVQEEREKDRLELVDIKRRQRILEDYAHDLRQFIVDGREPPPPPWPEGLRS